MSIRSPRLAPLAMLALAGGLLFTPARSSAADGPVELELRPWVDTPLLAFTATYTLVSMFGDETHWAGSTDFHEPAFGFDRAVAGQPVIDGEGPALLSDHVGITPSYALPFAMGAIGAFGLDAASGGERARRAGAYLVIGAQAVTTNATITHVVKHAVRRPRPYTHGEEWQAEAEAALAAGEPLDGEDQLSFYSGHTSAAGAWSFALAHTVGLTMDQAWYLEALPYLGAAGITAWTGVLRVRAHKHFPTDVLVGGLAGATVGILVPELHRTDGVRVAVGNTVDGTPTAGLACHW